MPSILASRLDDAIRDEVASVLLNPALILGPLKELSRIEKAAAHSKAASIQAAEKENEKLDAEEQRLLDAYRTGLISAAQLGKQLDKLKTRRAAPALTIAQAETPTTASIAETEEAIVDYCTKASANLAQFDEKQWRELLREVVESVHFHADHVQIVGKLPDGASGPSSFPKATFTLPESAISEASGNSQPCRTQLRLARRTD